MVALGSVSPCRSGFALKLWRKFSKARTYSMGESGKPSRIDRDKEKGFNFILFTSTMIPRNVYRRGIQQRKFIPNPAADKTVSKKQWLNQSKALDSSKHDSANQMKYVLDSPALNSTRLPSTEENDSTAFAC